MSHISPANALEDDPDGPLYASSPTVYQQSVKGRFRTIKWALLIACLGVYYFLPFVRWYRGPNLPDQAVLVDLANNRFYFFWIELWPQEIYYFTGLLVLAAISLFLMNAVAGRLWCGYLCPQTVWTDLFMAVERWVEGDRRERMLKDKQPMNARRVAEKGLKYFLWLMIAWWTGGAWVLYFADAPTLVMQLVTFTAPFQAYMWIGILTFTTFTLAGFMREQVCLYMCPWPRIQAALTDEWALNVTYRYDRGEPRMSAKAALRAKEAGQPAGDCVDCFQCVAVCPTGVDIRDGSQLGCIQCGLCIDACDNVMTRLGREKSLITYDNDINIQRRQQGKHEIYKLIRPRTIIYVAILALVGGLMLYKLMNRSFTDFAVVHDRNPLFVMQSDGGVQNGYTVRIGNKRGNQRLFVLNAEGVPAARVAAAGGIPTVDGKPLLEVGADATAEFRILVTVPKGVALEKSQDIRFKVVEVGTGDAVTVRDHFIAPE